MLAAIERRLKIAERVAARIEDPRDPDRVVHEFAEMIRYRALLNRLSRRQRLQRAQIRSGIQKAGGRLPESDGDLCSQPTIVQGAARTNLPGM